MTHVSYHNTTPLYGDQLMAAVRAAASQDAAVLDVMRGGGTWTPRQLWSFFQKCGRSWELTSIRRALSNLTKAGHLRITGTTVMGPKGKPENQWAIDTLRPAE